jgi:hypothetical protein
MGSSSSSDGYFSAGLDARLNTGPNDRLPANAICNPLPDKQTALFAHPNQLRITLP